MKKLFSILLLACMLSACGGDDDNNGKEVDIDTTDPTLLQGSWLFTYGYKDRDSSIWTFTPQQNINSKYRHPDGAGINKKWEYGRYRIIDDCIYIEKYKHKMPFVLDRDTLWLHNDPGAEKGTINKYIKMEKVYED